MSGCWRWCAVINHIVDIYQTLRREAKSTYCFVRPSVRCSVDRTSEHCGRFNTFYKLVIDCMMKMRDVKKYESVPPILFPDLKAESSLALGSRSRS